MKAKTVFFCTECGSESPKWSGRCAVCGAWNSMVEQPAERPVKSGKTQRIANAVNASPITSLQEDEEIRFPTGMGELDRVLGGGAVKGSLVLVGGAPGIGKSTLMLQICQQLGRTCKVLYVSGEESARQLKLRAKRLSVDSGNLFVLSETRLGDVLECIRREEPDVLIVDSIQTLYNEELDAPAGGVGQVKDCTMALMQVAKGQGVTVFVIGHVNKEGSIAGPKVLEFNARFGDPETQVVLPRLKNDLVEVMLACANCELDQIELDWRDEWAVAVVLTSAGYPGSYEKGKVITGIADAEAMENVTVYHAGTAIKDGKLVTNGGRVLGVTATAATLPEALKKAYAAADCIHFDKLHRRSDIGARALAAMKAQEG